MLKTENMKVVINTNLSFSKQGKYPKVEKKTVSTLWIEDEMVVNYNAFLLSEEI